MHLGNIFVIFVSSLRKKRSKKDQLCHVNKQHAIFMQMCAAITEKCIFSYSSVNITDNGTIRVSKSMF